MILFPVHCLGLFTPFLIRISSRFQSQNSTEIKLPASLSQYFLWNNRFGRFSCISFSAAQLHHYFLAYGDCFREKVLELIKSIVEIWLLSEMALFVRLSSFPNSSIAFFPANICPILHVFLRKLSPCWLCVQYASHSKVSRKQLLLITMQNHGKLHVSLVFTQIHNEEKHKKFPRRSMSRCKL